ncbi:MAG: divalent-cation tolerance protein CutA [Pirellulaceae bacterium]
MTRFITVHTTSDKKETLELIARELVAKNLVACAQLGGPITSIYRWGGQTEETQEYSLVLKTISEHFQLIVEMIHDIHHYDVPEIIATPIEQVSEKYALWLEEQTIRSSDTP